MSSIMAKSRPKHLNLLQIRLPVPGIVSILHRISGAILFLLLPLLLWLLQASLQSAESFARFQSLMAHPLAKLVLLGLFWGYAHHLLAGLRHLLLDLHIGTELETARASSMVVLAGGIVLTLALGLQIW
ncbi:MAG: succinate dehydrogenase, cytochrome b556 subunit [Betaproteobacteria bacterium]|nr:succinate dehydrogenase, cytochrome b556 subunit [Betaproteobacteria bacterium]